MKLRFFIFFSAVVFLVVAQAQAGHSISEIFESQRDLAKLTREDWARMRNSIALLIKPGDKVSPELQSAFYQIEERYYPIFSPESKAEYHSLLAQFGGKFRNQELALHMPSKQIPFWLETSDEFKNFRSAPYLPRSADIVVIGAGLTGTSAAYHLIDAARSGKSVVVLEATHPASQSSGKNGGNFQLLPENYIGATYDGLIEERLKWLRKRFPGQSNDELRPKAILEAKTLVRFSFLNMARIKDIVSKENLQCDLSASGWLRVANTAEEERALLSEIPWLKEMGAEGVEVISAEQIRDQVHIPAEFSGRLIRGSGNYHPFKFVKGSLQKAIAAGVQLYSGVEVSQVKPARRGEVLITTPEGQISAGKVIVATNAFTPKLFPELSAIHCIPSQLATFEHVKNELQGFTVTERFGDIYYNMPASTHHKDSAGVQRGMLLYGLDFGYSVSDPSKIPPSQDLLNQQVALVAREFPETVGQPPSRCWAGPMGFTDDRVPSIGFLYDDVIVAAAFQGYGGSFCIEAGYAAAQMALTGETPPEVPEELFSPKRLLQQ